MQDYSPSFYSLMIITGWAVALICYISHSAKHRKMADFDPKRAKTPEPILMKPGMVDYVRDPRRLDDINVQACACNSLYRTITKFSFLLF